MSCGCKTSGDSGQSCGTKANGCESVNTCGNSYKLSVFDWLTNINNPTQNKTDLVEVRFKNDRKSFYRNTGNLPLHIGSIVTVESSPGHDVGVVSLTGELVKIQMKKKKHPENEVLKIYRLANQKDIESWQNFRQRENDTKVDARKIAHALRLDMKITDVEYQGDGAKVTFYYTADSRIDFRQLIKDLANAFKTKIDMKQIGFRQEAAKIGGIGSCGRELCCSTWLTDFRSVNTNAARYQQLSINPQKLAGQCGKLKCCLNYELDSYMDALSHFPSSNTSLDTVNGRAYCIKIDVFKQKMWFAYADNSMTWYDLDTKEVKRLISLNKTGEKTPPLEDLRISQEPQANVDLIQQSNLDRFEKSERKNKFRKNNSTGSAPRTESGNRSKNGNQNRRSDLPKRPQQNKNEGSPENGKPVNKPNFRKKNPPKKDGNG